MRWLAALRQFLPRSRRQLLCVRPEEVGQKLPHTDTDPTAFSFCRQSVIASQEGSSATQLAVTRIKSKPLHGFWRVGVAANLIEMRIRHQFSI